MISEDELDRFERDARVMQQRTHYGAEVYLLLSRFYDVLSEARRLRDMVADLEKSQGYVRPPHWESHWDLGSMEEV